MTNEEAIKFHRENYQTFVETLWDGNEDNNPYDEAFKMAISALESIDRITAERDAAIRDLHSSENEHEGCGFCKYYSTQTNHCTKEDGAILCDTINDDMWEWRGIT